MAVVVVRADVRVVVRAFAPAGLRVTVFVVVAAGPRRLARRVGFDGVVLSAVDLVGRFVLLGLAPLLTGPPPLPFTRVNTIVDRVGAMILLRSRSVSTEYAAQRLGKSP